MIKVRLTTMHRQLSTKLALVLLLMVDSAQSAQAINNQWNGKWMLDRQASQFKGELTQIRRTASGYEIDLGAVRFTLYEDGKFHETTAGRATLLARIGPLTWKREHRLNNQIIDKSILAIKNHGRTLTISGEHDHVETLNRIGSGSGLEGRWRSTSLGINAADSMTIDMLGENRIHWEWPTQGNFYELTLNGLPEINQGRTASSIATLQISSEGNTEWRWIERLNGREFRCGEDLLSADALTLQETNWPCGQKDEKQVFIYRRQINP